MMIRSVTARQRRDHARRQGTGTKHRVSGGVKARRDYGEFLHINPEAAMTASITMLAMLCRMRGYRRGVPA